MDSQTILLVDDEQEILDMLQIFLKAENYEVRQAANGRAALELLASESIDLVILDYTPSDSIVRIYPVTYPGSECVCGGQRDSRSKHRVHAIKQPL